MNYSFTQLEQLWTQAGGNPAVAPTMAAIGLAESSGNPNAVNPTDNNGQQTSWGIWQISNGTHNPVSSSWNDPLTNAALAVQKYNSQGLSAWGSYNSGAYQNYLNSASGSTVQGTNVGFFGSSSPTTSLNSIGLTGGGGSPIQGVLTLVDRALNPHTHVGLGIANINTSYFAMFASRALFSIGGLGIMYMGLKGLNSDEASNGFGDAIRLGLRVQNTRLRGKQTALAERKEPIYERKARVAEGNQQIRKDQFEYGKARDNVRDARQARYEEYRNRQEEARRRQQAYEQARAERREAYERERDKARDEQAQRRDDREDFKTFGDAILKYRQYQETARQNNLRKRQQRFAERKYRDSRKTQKRANGTSGGNIVKTVGKDIEKYGK